jgi:hypothetical protein
MNQPESTKPDDTILVNGVQIRREQTGSGAPDNPGLRLGNVRVSRAIVGGRPNYRAPFYVR